MATARILSDRGPQVRILHENGDVDLPSITISKSGEEQVTWLGHESHPATIRFSSPDGSPFYQESFQVLAGGSIVSGPIRPEAEHKEYKYDVVGDGGVNDPKVIIVP